MKAHRVSVVAALVAALLVSAEAASAQKETPPVPGTPKEFTLPAKKEFALENGMKVTLIPFGSIPKVDAQLVVRAGNVDERADQVWLTDVMSDMMREGTLRRTSAEVNTAAANMGGSINTGVGQDEITVSGNALAEHASDLVRLLAEVALQPRFPDSELPRIKQNRLRSIALGKSQPQTLASEKFYNVLFPDHPYGRFFPTESMLQGYTIQQIRDQYDANFHASRGHLYVAGQFDATALERTIRDAFASWRAGTPKAPVPPTPASKRTVHIIDRPGAVQSSIVVGGPTIDPTHEDWRALQVTNMLLGGAFGSRITRNIREDKGYTYSPFSQISTRYRNAFWAEFADVTTAVTGASLEEIFAEIDRLQREPPSATELKGIQDNMAGAYIMGASSRGGMIGLLRSANLHGLPETYISNYMQHIYAVSPEDVTRVARQHIADDNFTIVIVGDRKVIEDQVKEYGPVM